MTIQSFSFIIFILILWLLTLFCRSIKSRQWLFLLASYIFYASWGLNFLLILIISSVVNYLLGMALRQKPTVHRLWAGISFNILLLVFFKYIPSLPEIFSTNLLFINVLHTFFMPIGISFWTFQALSYLFDLYQEKDVAPSLLEFCLYLAFWQTGPDKTVGQKAR